MKTQRTPVFLMANLGSEMARMFALLGKERVDEARQSAERAKKEIGRILEFPEMQARESELRVLEKIANDAVSASPTLETGAKEINEYFSPFARRVLTQ